MGIEDNEGQFDVIKQDFIDSHENLKQEQETYETRVETAEDLLKTLKQEQAQHNENTDAYKEYNQQIKQAEKALAKAKAEQEDFNNSMSDTAGLTAEATDGLSTIVEKIED